MKGQVCKFSTLLHVHVHCTRMRDTYMYMYMYIHVHVLMRDEKEVRKKEESNKQQGKATQHTQGSHFS